MPAPLFALGMSQLLRTEGFSHWPFLWRVNLHHKTFSKQLSRIGGLRMCFRAFSFIVESAE